jgi:mono/diheme cytochrome c family protein
VPRPRFTPVLALLPLLAAAAAAAELDSREIGDRAIAARRVLFKYCRECHGDAATGRLTVLDHGKLVDPGLVPVPFASRKTDSPRSQIVEFLKDGSMPPGGRDRPNPDEIKAVEEWLAAAAPGYPKAFDDPTTLAAILDDYERPERQEARPFLRYVSLAELADKPDAAKAIHQAQLKLQKALRPLALAGGPKLELAPVDETATVFRLDIRSLGWDTEDLFQKWGTDNKPAGVFRMVPFDLIQLEQPNPPAVPPKLADRTADALRKMNPHRRDEKTEPLGQLRAAAFVRGDWLADALLSENKPTPLADDLRSLVQLAAVLPKADSLPGDKRLTGPTYRPRAAGDKPTTGASPFGTFTAGDAASDAAPFTVTAEFVDEGGKQPVREVTRDDGFHIRVKSERDARVTLLRSDPADGAVEHVRLLNGETRLSAGQPREFLPSTGQAFFVNSLPDGPASGRVNFVLFVTAGDRPPVVIQSKHKANPVWRVVPNGDDPAGVVRKVLPLTVLREKGPNQ